MPSKCGPTRSSHQAFQCGAAVYSVDLSVPTIFGLSGPTVQERRRRCPPDPADHQPDAGQVVVLGNGVGKAADNRVGYLPEEPWIS